MPDPSYRLSESSGSLAVALLQPDIPQNAGNIARLCAATGTDLLLVRPLGFRLTDAQIRRAGMDYWEKARSRVFDDLADFLAWEPGRRRWYLSAHGTTSYARISYQQGDILCFGSESAGFPGEVLDAAKQQGTLITLPMIEGIRCLNVSSAAAATVYEALRQIHRWSDAEETTGEGS
jgi:tRNA (cytidine/uridine-2'-O-)-methyltransferase